MNVNFAECSFGGVLGCKWLNTSSPKVLGASRFSETDEVFSTGRLSWKEELSLPDSSDNLRPFWEEFLLLLSRLASSMAILTMRAAGS